MKVHTSLHFSFKLRASNIHWNYNRPTQYILSLDSDDLKEIFLLEIENFDKNNWENFTFYFKENIQNSKILRLVSKVLRSFSQYF